MQRSGSSCETHHQHNNNLAHMSAEKDKGNRTKFHKKNCMGLSKLW
jgi:hypothetical protein